MTAQEVERMAESLELSRNHHKPATGRLMVVSASLLREIRDALLMEEAMERMAEKFASEQSKRKEIETK
jgi:hypothetical protein